MLKEKQDIGIYVHIPFCKSKCYYCDFISFPNIESKEDIYVEALLKEIKKYGKENKLLSENGIEKRYNVRTIYIGGGTPSYIKASNIERIINTIKENFIIEDEAEISIEVNPGTVDFEKLKTYFICGINRISIGLQTANNKLLKTIGRIHTYEDFLETYKLATSVGFDNINVDLMIGLPKQTIKEVKEEIEEIVKLNPTHISIYSLILEENTKLYSLITSNKIKSIDDEKERKMYWYAKEYLEKQGYMHYEISNFAKPNYKCQHNIDCWNQKEYMGFGLAAASFMNNVRYRNEENLIKYLRNIANGDYSKNLIFDERLTKLAKMKEYMILGLRKTEGVNILKFMELFGISPFFKFMREFDKLVNEGLLTIDDHNIKLTNKGLDYANIVWEEFL